MSGSILTITALVAESNSTLATGQASGAITPARLNQLSLDSIATLSPNEATLTFSTTLAWNLDTSPVAYVVLTNNTTITLSNGQNGRSYRLAVKQDATGGRTVTLSGATLLGAAVWSTAANAVNIISVDMVNGTRFAGIM